MTNKLKPEQHIQDIILASKGYYEVSEDEKAVDLMRRICDNITGCGSEDYPLSSVNRWLYEAFDWLINNNIISKGSIREYILGTHTSQNLFFFNKNEDKRCPVEISFDFLYGEISLCEITNIELNLNSELATDNDYIRKIRNTYDMKFNTESIEISKNGKVLKIFNKGNGDYMGASYDAEHYIEEMAKKEYYNRKETVAR